MANLADSLNEKIQPIKSKLFAQIGNNPMVKQGQQWFDGLPPRDQLVVKVVGVLLAIALVFVAVWVPARDRLETAQSKVKSELELHQWMQDNAVKIRGNKGTSRKSSNQSILAIVNSSAKSRNIKLKRFEPDGKDGLRIWLEGEPFDDVISWFEGLQYDQGVSVFDVNIEKDGVGRVSVRATLKK